MIICHILKQVYFPVISVRFEVLLLHWMSVCGSPSRCFVAVQEDGDEKMCLGKIRLNQQQQQSSLTLRCK